MVMILLATVQRAGTRPAVLGLLLGAAVVAVVSLAPQAAAARAAALLLAPAAALGAALAAARAAPGGGRAPWHAFAAGAALVLAAQLLPAADPAAAGDLLLLFPPIFTLGALLGLRLEGARKLALAVALDGLLVVVAVALLAERFMLEPLQAAHALTGWSRVARLAILAAVPGSVTAAAILLLWREAAVPARSIPALALSALCFAGATLVPGFALAGGAGGWVFLAYAGLLALEAPLRTVRAGVPGPTGETLGRLVVPGAALLLGLAGVDAALRPGADAATATTLCVMGVLLTLRTLSTLRGAERRAEERRQLQHTRALVEVSRALAGATEVPGTLDLVTQWACRLTGARAAAIELLIGEGRELEIMAAAGLPSHALGLRYSLEDSFTGKVVRSGEARVTEDSTSDPSIQPVSRGFLGHSAVAAVPLQYGERALGVLSCIRDRSFSAHELELLRALADQAAIAIETARLFEQVHGLSVTDPLTGLANRRQLERDLAREFAAAQRGRRVVLVLFDLDEFKPYNDRFGHLAGDAALRAFGQVLAHLTRAMNLAARYGGDEFVVLLSDTDLEGAQTFIDRIRSGFAAEIAALGHGELPFSAGVAEYSPEMADPHDLLEAADRALYENKAVRSSR